MYNTIRESEYIPKIFKRGVQVPLYKGKDTCVLDANNYRGITLLPSYHKLFEILIWQRLKGWWHNEKIISDLQGACRKGFSFIHTAFNLRETVAASMETTKKCFVAFFDVAKALDTVWIDGLFKQMYDLGIMGKTWRLLYRGYVGFKCCVKLNGNFSKWYEPLCGIHQGGFMSLMKYTIFINSLLVDLRHADICCKIYMTPSTPLGYADDVATCCLSKRKIDRAMDIVYNHGCVWRYEFNAKKSGILVYGESKKEHALNSPFRQFQLGENRVNERKFYDHVGIRNSIFDNDNSGIVERITKSRRVFNSIAGIGIREGGVTIATCSVIFWSVVVPTALYGCELWIMNESNLGIIEDFQNYIGKRVQRFHPKVLNSCSYYGLGWMRLERIIQIKKLLFVRLILVMSDDELPKIVFCERTSIYLLNPHIGHQNDYNSAVYDLLNVCDTFGLLIDVRNMVERQYFYSKANWRDKVWKKGWELEDTYWNIEKQLHKSLDLLGNVHPSSRYLTWWSISDRHPSLVRECSVMSKILSHASILRSDDFKLKEQLNTFKMCDLCDRYEVEDARHLILHCPFFHNMRTSMSEKIDEVEVDANFVLNECNVDMLYILLGRTVVGLNDTQMEKIWLIALEFVYSIYREIVKRRRGIG